MFTALRINLLCNSGSMEGAVCHLTPSKVHTRKNVLVALASIYCFSLQYARDKGKVLKPWTDIYTLQNATTIKTGILLCFSSKTVFALGNSTAVTPLLFYFVILMWSNLYKCLLKYENKHNLKVMFSETVQNSLITEFKVCSSHCNLHPMLSIQFHSGDST